MENIGKNSKLRNRIISFLLRYPDFFYKYIHTYFPFSDEFLSKYRDVVNWPIISYNSSLINNWDFIEKYKDVLDWETITMEHLNWNEYYVDKYIDKIVWKPELIKIGPDDYYRIDTFAANPAFNWDLNTIDKYKSLIFWKDLSKNESDFWDTSILEKYRNFLNWSELSHNHSVPVNTELLEKYRDKWNWEIVLSNTHLCSQQEAIEKYQGKLSWYTICQNNKGLINDAFIKKWHHFIHWRSIASNESYTNSHERFVQHLDKWYLHNCFIPLSGNHKLPWSIQFIEEYINDWDWEMLSLNEGLPWSVDFINIFEDKLSFGKTEPISSYESIIGLGIRDLINFPWSIDILERYEHKWDFNGFVQNKSLWEKAFKPYVDQEMVDLIFKILQ